MSQTYTVKEVAEMLEYSTNSIYSFLKEGRIKGIRVGKGRFRISQEEIDRLLQTNKIKEEPLSVDSPRGNYLNQSVNSLAVDLPVEEVSSSLPKLKKTVEQVKVKVPSLFDWFIGLGSIIFGITAILFVGHTNELGIKDYTSFIFPIKITMIVGGVGILLADIIGKAGIRWHKIFFFILGLAYCSFTAIYISGGDLEGAALFGLTTLVMFLHIIWEIETIASFILYVGGIILLIPFAILIKPSISLGFQPALLTYFSPQMNMVIWGVLSAIVALVLSLSYTRSNFVFKFAVILVTVDLAVLSYLYGINLFWGRSLFFLLAALLCMFIPLWRTFHFLNKSDRRIIFATFGAIFLIFILIISVLLVIQINLKVYVGSELIDKTNYGKSFLDSVLTTSQATLDNLDQNPLLQEAIVKKDSNTFDDLARAILDATPNFRRIVVFSSNGDSLFIYPHGVLTEPNISFRDYFKKAVTEKQSNITDSFETRIDGVTRSVVAVATPILDSKNDVVGVLVGSLDLDSIGNRIGKMANESKKEYFTIVDRTGKVLMESNQKLVSTQWPLYSSTVAKRSSGELVSQDPSPNGDIIIHAYSVLDKNGWGVDVAQPLSAALSITDNGAFVVISLVLFSGLTIIQFLSFLKKRD